MSVLCAVMNCITIFFPLDPSTQIYHTSQTIFEGHKSLWHNTACLKICVFFIPFPLLPFYFLFLFPPVLRIYEVKIHRPPCRIKPTSDNCVHNNSLQFIVLPAQGHLNNTVTWYCVVHAVPTWCEVVTDSVDSTSWRKFPERATNAPMENTYQ